MRDADDAVDVFAHNLAKNRDFFGAQGIQRHGPAANRLHACVGLEVLDDYRVRQEKKMDHEQDGRTIVVFEVKTMRTQVCQELLEVLVHRHRATNICQCDDNFRNVWTLVVSDLQYLCPYNLCLSIKINFGPRMFGAYRTDDPS